MAESWTKRWTTLARTARCPEALTTLRGPFHGRPERYRTKAEIEEARTRDRSSVSVIS